MLCLLWLRTFWAGLDFIEALRGLGASWSEAGVVKYLKRERCLDA